MTKKKSLGAQKDISDGIERAAKALENVLIADQINRRCHPFSFGTWAKKKPSKKTTAKRARKFRGAR